MERKTKVPTYCVCRHIFRVFQLFLFGACLLLFMEAMIRVLKNYSEVLEVLKLLRKQNMDFQKDDHDPDRKFK
jgi:hypothetical protein